MFPKYLDKEYKVPSSVTPQVDMTDLIVNKFSKERMLEILENSGRNSTYLVDISKGKLKECVFLHKDQIRVRTFDEDQFFGFSGLTYSGFFIFTLKERYWEKYTCFSVKLSPVAVTLLENGSYEIPSLVNYVHNHMAILNVASFKLFHKNQFIYNMRPKIIQINTNIRPIVRNVVSVGKIDPSWYISPSSDPITLVYDERTCTPKKIIFDLKYGIMQGQYKIILPDMRSCQNILLNQLVKRGENYGTVANGLYCRYGGKDALGIKIENEILIL